MLDEYFKTLAALMSAESDLLGSVYRHRGKLGENREALLQRFLATYLPKRFAVGSGFALFGDEVSTQQDVVVYDQLNNPILFPDSVAALFPPSALAAVVEVKSVLRRDELRNAAVKLHKLKTQLRAAFANHPAPPRSEALACLFAFDSQLDPAGTLHALKTIEEELGAEMRDRIDCICVLGKGLVLGGSLFYSTMTGGEPLLPESPPLRQQRVAFDSESSLLIFYSRLLDYVMGRSEVRPQLMSYVPPDMPLGSVVATG